MINLPGGERKAHGRGECCHSGCLALAFIVCKLDTTQSSQMSLRTSPCCVVPEKRIYSDSVPTLGGPTTCQLLRFPHNQFLVLIFINS